MPKGITYFCTDSTGETFNRHSSGHQTAHYFTACIVRLPGEPVVKNNVSYSATVARAPAWVGRHPKATAEVVEVRAYHGKWAKEPSADLRVDVLR